MHTNVGVLLGYVLEPKGVDALPESMNEFKRTRAKHSMRL